MRMGRASVTEYINEILLADRPLNYYLNISAMSERAFDMLMGAVLARSLHLRMYQPPRMPARIYMPCRPNDVELLHVLAGFGFQNDDGEIGMRRILNPNDRIPMPPVGCKIAPVILENEQDYEGLLQRVNQYSLTTKTMDWVVHLQQEQMFTVYGVWQDSRLLGELVLTAYGTEGRIEFIYTSQHAQRRGVATSLIAHAGDVLLRSGIRSANAVVWKRNIKAMTLFQAMGYDSVSPIILYPGIDIL